jgi:hypothetical protein
MALTQGTTAPIPFYLALASDHITPATGKTVTVTLSKAGSAFAAPASTIVTETGSGWYTFTPIPLDTNTPGPFILHATAAACDPVNDRHTIGSDAIVAGSLIPILVFHALSSDHVTGGTGLSPTILLSKAGGGFGSPAGVVSEVGVGWYKLTPTAADTGTVGTLAVHSTAATADPDDFVLDVVPAATLPWSSGYLLDLFNRYASRPTTDEVTDTQKYRWLSEAQTGVVADIAARSPNVLFGAPTALITSDNKTFTFGTNNNGYAVFPQGNVRVFTSLNNVPDYPLHLGVDYVSEGTTIRIPNNRTLSGPLYWQGITTPPDITASTQPSLFPEASRNLIALDAARRFMATQGRPDLSDDLQRQYDRELPRWLLVWKRQFSNGGALGAVSGLRLDMRTP